jgi:hypothetical protein
MQHPSGSLTDLNTQKFANSSFKVSCYKFIENRNFTITRSRKVGSLSLSKLFSKTKRLDDDQDAYDVYEYIPKKEEEVIVVFRDPVDKLLSGHFMQLGKILTDNDKFVSEFWNRLRDGYYLEDQQIDDVTKEGLEFVVKFYEDKKWQFKNQASFLYSDNGSSITPIWNSWKDYKNIKWLHLDRLDNNFLKYVHKKVPSTSWCIDIPNLNDSRLDSTDTNKLFKKKIYVNKYVVQIKKLLNDNNVVTDEIFYHNFHHRQNHSSDNDGVEGLLSYILRLECRTYDQIMKSNRLFKYE